MSFELITILITIILIIPGITYLYHLLKKSQQNKKKCITHLEKLILQNLESQNLLLFKKYLKNIIKIKKNFKTTTKSTYLHHIVFICSKKEKNIQTKKKKDELKNFIEKIINFLISLNCDIDNLDFSGRTPFFTACWHSSEIMIDLLLKKNCDPYKRIKVYNNICAISCLFIRKKNFDIIEKIFLEFHLNAFLVLKDVKNFKNTFNLKIKEKLYLKGVNVLNFLIRKQECLKIMEILKNKNNHFYLLNKLKQEDKDLLIKKYILNEKINK